MKLVNSALSKIADLERYVNTLAKRLANEKPNTVTFFSEQSQVGRGKSFNFSFETERETSLFLDMSAVVSGFGDAFEISVSVNNSMVQKRQFSGANIGVARLAFSFFACFGENQIDIAIATTSDYSVLNSLTMILSGMNLLSQAKSLVHGLKTDGVWMFGEAKNNTLSLVSENLLSSQSLKTFDFAIQDFFMAEVDGQGFAFLLSSGGLYSVSLSSGVQTKKLANSIQSAAIGKNGQTSTLIAVCRNRLFSREITSEMKSGVLVPLSLNSSEKILRARTTFISTESFALCLETTNRIHVYLNENGKFELLESLSQGGLCGCFFEEEKLFIATSNVDVLRVFCFDFNTRQISAGKNLGSFSSFFQFKQGSALTSRDNKLSILNF